MQRSDLTAAEASKGPERESNLTVAPTDHVHP